MTQRLVTQRPRQRRFRRGIVTFLVTLAMLIAVELAFYEESGGQPWLTPWGASALGIFTSLWAFIGGLGLLRRILRIEWTSFAVARVVLEEAMRRKIAVSCTAILITTVVVLPFILDPNAQIAYRVQSFLTYSLTATALLLSIITVFLACASISDEIEDRRIHTVLVKPVRRSAYLIGKLLGIMLLNLLLLTVTGTAIFAFAHLQVAREAQVGGGRAIDSGALRRIYREVLVARETLYPTPPLGYLEEAVQRAMKDPDNEERIAHMGGLVAFQEAALEEAEKQWRFVQPGDRLPYVYRGLTRALEESPEDVVLRLRPRAIIGPRSQQDPVDMILHFDQGRERFPLAAKEVKTVELTPYLDGDELLVVIENHHSETDRAARGSVMFTPEDGLPQVIFPVGGFAGNLVRGLLIIWCRVGFLAALGVCASTILGFPVACLFTLILMVSAVASAHIIDEHPATAGSHAGHSHAGHSHGPHGHDHEEEGGGVIEVLQAIGLEMAGFLREYSRYPVVSRVLDGRIVPWSEVGRIWFRVGLLWSGALVLLGVILFRRREVAAVQV